MDVGVVTPVNKSQQPYEAVSLLMFQSDHQSYSFRDVPPLFGLRESATAKPFVQSASS
jgi:hypothetical protein